VSASFGTLLRQLRIAARLSQEALAESAGISAAAIGAYERGVRAAPHRDSVELLADALGLAGERLAEFKAAARPKPRAHRAFNLDPAAPARTLPPEMTTFVGRESEVAEILEILKDQRLITITGAGGVGKTRVALRIASRQQRADGAWFVDLGSVRDPSRVVAKISSVVPRPFRDDESPEALADSLRDRSTLLVLDNCEHVLEAVGAVVAALARTAPNVAVLATSRHRLNVSSEFVFRLSPLPYPDTLRLTALEARRFAAVDLFVLRASAADQRFVFTDDHVAAVVDICRRVEGVPLAVELAAARLPMFGLTTLRKKLGERLDLLKSTVRDVPERQQTFRATIDWSYGLLEEPERSLLLRLAIFAGGCTLESAEYVCTDESMPRDWVVDGLSALVDHSLISADIARSSPRYTLLESTRQYALEKLEETERGRLAARHAAWCAAFADDVRFATLELTHSEWNQLVLPEFDNIYQAIDWATEHDRLLFASIVGSLYFMWWRIGRPEEGHRFADEALSDLDEDAHPAIAAQLLLARSIILIHSERLKVIERAVTLLERLGEPRGLAEAYLHLGGVYLMTRDRKRLAPLVERVAQLVKRSGERNLSPLISWLRGGVYALDGKFAEARDELVLALEGPKVSEQEAGYVIGHELANVEYLLGNVQRAAALCDELVAASRLRRLANHEVYALVKSSGFHLLLGDTERAERAARDALFASRQLNEIVLKAAVQHLATIAALHGDVVRATRLHGYVDARLGSETDNQVNLPFACRDILIASIDEHLTPAEKAHHMAAGALLGEEAAIGEALQARSAMRTPKVQSGA
jgi:predicted ATPase/DNA-binding XRE family transcriptional regulator